MLYEVITGDDARLDPQQGRQADHGDGHGLAPADLFVMLNGPAFENRHDHRAEQLSYNFV